MFIGIKDGKVWDICSDMLNARISETRSGDTYSQEFRDTVSYVEVPDNNFDIYIEDTWDFKINDSLKDSPARIPQLDNEDVLQEKIQELEDRIKALEEAKGL